MDSLNKIWQDVNCFFNNHQVSDLIWPYKYHPHKRVNQTAISVCKNCLHHTWVGPKQDIEDLRKGFQVIYNDLSHRINME